MSQLPKSQKISERLRSDPRFIQIEGRLLNHGSGGGRLELSHLLEWYQSRVRNVGLERAESDLQTFLDSDSISVVQALWIYGTFCESVLQLTQDTTLVPLSQMPDSSEKMEFGAHAWQSRTFHMPAPRAALVRNIQVPKILPNFTISGPDPGWEEANKNYDGSASELSAIALLMNCISGICCLPGYFTSHVPPETPSTGASSSSAPLFDVLPRRLTKVDAEELRQISSLFERFQSSPPEPKTRLQSALHRLAQAKAKLNHADKVLDLGIALEMLLLNAEHRNQELPGQLNLHFRLRGAWLLGKTLEERTKLYRTLRDIYAYRSQIAHNGFSAELNNMDSSKREAMLAAFVEVGERTVRELVLSPSTSWERIVLGEAYEKRTNSEDR